MEFSVDTTSSVELRPDSGTQTWSIQDRRIFGRNRRCIHLTALGVFLLLFSVYLLTNGGSPFISDGIIMFKTTEAILEFHTLELEPDPLSPFQVVEGRGGRHFSKYGIGQPLAAAPLYAFGAVVHNVWLDYMWDNAVKMYFVSLFNPLATALTGAVMFLLAFRLRYGIYLSLFLALTWGLCSLAWPYTRVYFSEPLYGLCLVSAAYFLLRYKQTEERHRLAWLFLAGASLGYAILTRVAGIIVLPWFTLYAVWAASYHPEAGFLRDLRTSWRSHTLPHLPSRHVSLAAITVFAGPLVLAIAFMLIHNFLRFGDALNNGYSSAESFRTPLTEGLVGLLLSPGKSIFIYVPLTALSVVAWRPFWVRERPTAMLYTAIILSTLLQSALWWSWWGGWSWGPRLLVPVLPFAFLGLGPLLQRSELARIAAVPLAALGFVVALLGTLVDFNPYLAGVQEPEVYFEPGQSPILAHLRSLLDGEHIAVATFRLESLGFNDRFAAIAPLLIILMICASLAITLYGVSRYERTLVSPPTSES